MDPDAFHEHNGFVRMLIERFINGTFQVPNYFDDLYDLKVFDNLNLLIFFFFLMLESYFVSTMLSLS